MTVVLDKETIAADIVAGLDLSAKTVVITGATAGLGEQSAKVLAGAGASLVLTGRDQQKLTQAVARIHSDHPRARIATVVLELSEPASVHVAAAEIQSIAPRIDVLLNNAGVMAPPLSRNSKGWESQFAGNHMGHFMLTGLLMPALIAAAPSRIVVLSSSGHQMGVVDFDDPHFERREYAPFEAYGQSKTANILFTIGLAKRLRGKKVTANAIMPGAVATPGLRHIGGAESLKAFNVFVKTIPQGAATQVWACVAPELAAITGRYLEDCALAVVNDDPRSVGEYGYRTRATDPEDAERLWILSEALAEQRFCFT